MNCEIEKDIAIPKGGTGRGRNRYPLLSMSVGDSFYIPTLDNESVRKAENRVRGSIRYAALRTGAAFSIRRVDGGIRVWRVIPPFEETA